MAVPHDLKDDVLVAVAESGSEGIGGVGGGGPVDDDRAPAGLDLVEDVLVGGEGGDGERSDRDVLLAARAVAVRVEGQLELAAVVPAQRKMGNIK